MDDTQKQRYAAVGLASIRQMLAALDVDYGRLDELREAVKDRDRLVATRDNPGTKDLFDEDDAEELARLECSIMDDAEELAELEEAAGDCTDEDDARQRIQDDPLSIEVRSGWHAIGEDAEDAEFCILLTTGGPALRIIGELRDGEPHRAWIEDQDWGTLWTEYYEEGVGDICLRYAQQFCFQH